MIDPRTVDIARHVQHLHLWPQRPEPLGELASAHLGHHHIGQEQVARVLVLLAGQECFPRTDRRQSGVECPLPSPS